MLAKMRFMVKKEPKITMLGKKKYVDKALSLDSS